jgi:NTP pyrophosphatase (non-canonical NTP hydrolase)
MEDIWQKLIDFNDCYFPDWRNTHEIYYSNAIAGESGELCNMIKHRDGGGTNRSKPIPTDEDVIEECADIFIYVSLLVSLKGFSYLKFKQAINRKMMTNVQRMKNR